MYETTDFRGVSTSERLYLSVTRRTKADRLALYQSFDVAPPTCVAPAARLLLLLLLLPLPPALPAAPCRVAPVPDALPPHTLASHLLPSAAGPWPRCAAPTRTAPPSPGQRAAAPSLSLTPRPAPRPMCVDAASAAGRIFGPCTRRLPRLPHAPRSRTPLPPLVTPHSHCCTRRRRRTA